jgi:hypothetical protein
MPACSICRRTRSFPRRRSEVSVRDSRLFDLPADAELSTTAERSLRPRDRPRDARVVYRALLEQPVDGIVDGVGVVTLAAEALPHLHFRKLAPREHLQTIEVGAGHAGGPGGRDLGS